MELTFDVLEEEEVTAQETAEELSLTTNIYAEIRARLARRGIPRGEVAFIHDARTPAARQALFEAVNLGEIRVLIGSTEKMGTGMNVQERCIAMHTLTPPWRPGDIEQQVGRMWRQGNKFPQVFQFVHLTEGSFDGYVYQLLENKAGFISQIMSGNVSSRELDDVDETVLTFSEIKALASGNPKILLKVTLDAELARLSAIRATWLNARAAMQSKLHFRASEGQFAKEKLAWYREAVALRDANASDSFTIQVRSSLDDDAYTVETDRETAGHRLRVQAGQAAMRLIGGQAIEKSFVIGAYRGFPIHATVTSLIAGEDWLPEPSLYFLIGREILPIGGTSDEGLTRSMDIRLRALDTTLADVQDRVRAFDENHQKALEELERPWEHQERYERLQAEVQALDAELNASNETPAAPLSAYDLQAPGSAADENEVRQAIDAICAMLADPAVLALFRESAEQENIPVSAESLEALGREIEQMQALYDLGASLVQLDLFGGSVPAIPKKNRRRS
jgi:hypothetical protein